MKPRAPGARLRAACLASALAALLSGCTISRHESDIARSHEEVSQRTEKADQLLRAYPGTSPTVVSSSTPRFTTHSVPLDRSEMLPNHIATVTLRVPGRHSIRTIAMLIEQATQIPVHVSSDATLPPSMFAPVGMGGQAGAETRSTRGGSSAAVLEGVQRAGGNDLQAGRDSAQDGDIEINYSGSLAGLLHQVALRADLRWSYESGRINFFRVISRSLAIKTLPGGLKTTASLSMGSTGGGNTSSVSSSEINIWSGIEKNLGSMISVSGKVVIDPNTGTINVRDAFRNVEAIEQYVKLLNQNMMRQVSMTVEVLQVNLKSEFQTGIDWNYISETMRLGQLQLRAPTSVASPETATSIGLVLRNSAGTNNQLLFQALEKFGQVSSAYSTVVTTVNRQPVPVGNQTTQSYLKSVTPTVINTGGVTSVGPATLTPGEITTGFSLTLLPILLDSNHVLIECGLSLSALKSLTSFNSGTGANLQTIQQPSIGNFAVQQRLVAKSNETLVLSGFDAELLESQQVDPLVQKVPGSRKGTKDRTTTVVLITPRLMEQ